MTQSRNQSTYRDLVCIKRPIVYYLRTAIVNDLRKQFHAYGYAALGLAAQGLGSGTADQY